MAAEEKKLWIATLEAEERARLSSLRASTEELKGEEVLLPRQVNALLVAALQAELTLMRMSRVFPSISSSRCTDVSSALGHGPTAVLASRLHHFWRALGVTQPTLKVLLREIALAVGEQTRMARMELFVGTVRNMRRGVDPKARSSLAAEGGGQLFS